MSLRSWAPEAILLTACVAILACQLFIPPFIGLANNGDFGKVIGRFSLGADGGEENFDYFKPDYVYGPAFYWRSDILSSEIVLTWIALVLAKAAWMGDRFDIRFLGAVHAALFVAAYWILLRAMHGLRALARFAIGAFVLLALTDVSYVAYFNSLYSDTAAYLGLLLTIALALRLLTGAHGAASLVAFTAAAVLMITAKSQHALPGMLALAVPLWIGWHGARLTRILCAASAACILGAVMWTFASTPRLFSAVALFNVVFYQIAADSTNPQADLRELGLDEQYDRYAGMHAFQPDAPTNSISWLEAFVSRVRYSDIARFWLRHPGRALSTLKKTLWNEAPPIRPTNLSNFRRIDGQPPKSLTRRFSAWSDFRVSLYVMWRAHIVLWYAGVLALCVILRRRLSAVCGAIAVAGLLEFLLAAFADAIETYRHLFLFHALTDLTICFAFAWLVYQAQNRIAPEPR